MKPFIPDKEIVLNEDTDLLKTKVYSDNLVKVIENAPKDEVFSVGLYGGWGAGKSSIIRSAKSELEAKTDKKIKFITYDAWKYSNDSFRRMFLLKIQEELKLKQGDEMKRFYQSETTEAEPRVVLNLKGILISLFVLLLLIGFLSTSSLTFEQQLPIAIIGTFGSFLIALFSGCFYELKLSINKPILFAPEQFEDCFRQMMRICLKNQNEIESERRLIYVTTGKHSVENLDKLVIVIDNIDRCPCDMTYQLLADIKTFLCDEKFNIVFVVPVDEKALTTHLLRQWNTNDISDVNKEQDEYLRKIFNVVLRIKAHQETELQFFTNQLNKKYNLGYSQDTLAIVSKVFADNPRRIIQLLNNLRNELNLYEESFSQKYESVICAVLIIREEFPDFYQRVLHNYTLLNNYAGEYAVDKNRIDAFLRISSGVFHDVSVKVLQKIFTNTDCVLNVLPIEIQTAVRTFDTDKSIQFFKENKELRSAFITFLLNGLQSDEKYNAKSQMTQWVDYCVKLYSAGVIDVSCLSKIDECLKLHYELSIPYVQDTKALCRFANDLKKRGHTRLYSELMSFLQKDEVMLSGKYQDLIKSVFSTLLSDKYAEQNKNLVQRYYLNNPIEGDIAFSEVQKLVYFDYIYVNNLLTKMTSFDDKMVMGNIQWLLVNVKGLSSEAIDGIINKFLSLFGHTRNKKCSEYIDFINKIHPFLENIGNQPSLNNINNLYKTIVGPRGIARQGYQNNPNYDKRMSILDQVDDAQAIVVVNFGFEIFRISNGTIDISDTLNKLVKRCSDLVYSNALKIIEKEVPLRIIAPVLVQSENYESEDVLSVLKHILMERLNDGFVLDETMMKSKLESLLLHINNISVVSMIESIMKDEKIKSIIISIIVEKGLLNTMPISISKHLISSFNRETADVYQNNTEFLSLVANKGKPEQKKEVVRLLRKDLVNETNYDHVIEVLSHLDIKDKSVLMPMVEDLKIATNNKGISEVQKGKMLRLIDDFE